MWFKIDDSDLQQIIPATGIDACRVQVIISDANDDPLFDAENTIGEARALGYAKETWELVPSIWVLIAMVLILVVQLILKK